MESSTRTVIYTLILFSARGTLIKRDLNPLFRIRHREEYNSDTEVEPGTKPLLKRRTFLKTTFLVESI